MPILELDNIKIQPRIAEHQINCVIQIKQHEDNNNKFEFCFVGYVKQQHQWQLSECERVTLTLAGDPTPFLVVLMLCFEDGVGL
jgi:hypothetical protein